MLGEFYFRRVEIGVEFASNGESRAGCGVGDQIDDGLISFQLLASPVETDSREQAMFDLIPFACARRIVTHNDLQDPWQRVGQV